jgi:hypothetical protein
MAHRENYLPVEERKGRLPAQRPEKYNVASCAVVLAALRRGATRSAAAAIAGVTRHTFNVWLDHRVVPDGVRLPAIIEGEAEVDFSGMEFVDAVELAQQMAGDFLASRILIAASEAAKITYHYGRNGQLLREVREFDWKAAAWLLEHNPDLRKDWIAPKQLEVSGPDGNPVQVNGVQVVTWAPDQAWLEQYAKAQAEVDSLHAAPMKNVTPGSDGDELQPA